MPNTGLNTGGTTEALANKEKASVKQLQWEMSRDRWMKDLNRQRKGGMDGGRPICRSIRRPIRRLIRKAKLRKL